MDADRIAGQGLGGGGARPVGGTIGIRSQNPGNIRAGATQWQGQTGVNEKGFCIFSSSLYGIRALAKLLLTYHDKYGLCTVRTLINRWAPPVENDTGSYVSAVCGDTCFDPDAWLHVGEPSILSALVRAVIHHENGPAGLAAYDDTEIAAGVNAALK